MLRLSILTVVLGILPALLAAGNEEPERRGRLPPSQEAADASSPTNRDASWELEVFGHGGLAGLALRGEVVGSARSYSTPPQETGGLFP